MSRKREGYEGILIVALNNEKGGKETWRVGGTHESGQMGQHMELFLRIVRAVGEVGEGTFLFMCIQSGTQFVSRATHLAVWKLEWGEVIRIALIWVTVHICDCEPYLKHI